MEECSSIVFFFFYPIFLLFLFAYISRCWWWFVASWRCSVMARVHVNFYYSMAALCLYVIRLSRLFSFKTLLIWHFKLWKESLKRSLVPYWYLYVPPAFDTFDIVNYGQISSIELPGMGSILLTGSYLIQSHETHSWSTIVHNAGIEQLPFKVIWGYSVWGYRELTIVKDLMALFTWLATAKTFGKWKLVILALGPLWYSILWTARYP